MEDTLVNYFLTNYIPERFLFSFYTEASWKPSISGAFKIMLEPAGRYRNPLPSWCPILLLMPYEWGKEWVKTTPLLPIRWYLLLIVNKSECDIIRFVLSSIGHGLGLGLELGLGLGLILLILPVLVADVIENSRMIMAMMPLIAEDWWIVCINIYLYRELQRQSNKKIW